ncbi:MAG: hypothetical protein LBP80_05975 [Treponema sp.]|jgi:hypothetical protein|nr:hypothetical protein [Treponema sp.]
MPYSHFTKDEKIALQAMAGMQGNSTYFLIVKISLNSPEFPGKINHNELSVRGAYGAQRRHETTLYSFLLRLCVPLWFKILQCFGKFQPLENKCCCPGLNCGADYILRLWTNCFAV